jgi:tripartite-type tricarboxylate transporter receptor subunit TctC
LQISLWAWKSVGDALEGKSAVRSHVRRMICLAVVSMGLAASAMAQQWPTRPITLIVPFAAGGAPDIIARLVGQDIGDKLGQKIVVENRIGASGNIGAAAVAKSAPDGYTLLLGTPNPIVLNKLIEGAKQQFDPDTTLTPIVLLGKSASMLVTSPKNSAATMKDLIARAKASPKKLSAGVPGIGTSSHIAMELVMQLTGTKFNIVPYRGTPPLADIVGGDLDVAITPTIAFISQVNGGTLHPLAVTSLERSTQAPDVPTLHEIGLSGFEATTWYVLMAPTGTPPAVIERLNLLVNDYLTSPSGQKMLIQFDVAAGGGTPKDAKDYLRSEVDKWRPIVKAANFTIP